MCRADRRGAVGDPRSSPTSSRTTRRGSGFLDGPRGARARGVTVRVLADFFGSFATRRRFWARDAPARASTCASSTRSSRTSVSSRIRDHRKILVVDRRIGFTGGMNIADEYGSARRLARAGPWRDTHVRVEGTDRLGDGDGLLGGLEARGRRSARTRAAVEDRRRSPCRILTLDSRPGRGHGETAAVLAAIVAAATPARLDHQRVLRARAGGRSRSSARPPRRGVDVRLLLPGRTDVPARPARRARLLPRLLEAGVRIFEYRAAILHAKTLVADDFVSVVGSTNLDFRSFHFNAECNLVILDDGRRAYVRGGVRGGPRAARPRSRPRALAAARPAPRARRLRRPASRAAALIRWNRRWKPARPEPPPSCHPRPQCGSARRSALQFRERSRSPEQSMSSSADGVPLAREPCRAGRGLVRRISRGSVRRRRQVWRWQSAARPCRR